MPVCIEINATGNDSLNQFKRAEKNDTYIREAGIHVKEGVSGYTKDDK